METKALKGGEFIIKETEAKDIFIPEEFSEDQKMMADTCSDFMEKGVLPNIEAMDKHDRKILRKMFDDAGELGLLGISVPEEYDGFGQNMVTSMNSEKDFLLQLHFQHIPESEHYQYCITEPMNKRKSIYLNWQVASGLVHIALLSRVQVLMPTPENQKQF